jgi:putative NIF3 family GTP cyclohydrolase 1 type 2
MLQSIASFLDEFLKIEDVEDFPNALNGLQLENDGRVTRIGAAVDASEAVIELAVSNQVDLLLVHHGLFWGGLTKLAGAQFRKIQRAIFGNLAVYSAHLPLDMHPEVGNNILLARALNLGEPEPFFLDRGHHLGVAISTAIDRAVQRRYAGWEFSLEAGAANWRKLGPKESTLSSPGKDLTTHFLWPRNSD